MRNPAFHESHLLSNYCILGTILSETNPLKVLSVWLMKCFALTVIGQVRLGAQVCVGPSFILPLLYPGLACFYQTVPR